MSDILVVSDETWVLNDVRAALIEPRYTLHEVDDPRQVTERLGETDADVVIVDLQIGSMGGMAVTRAIRDRGAAHSGAAPPVVLLLDRDADAFLAGRSGAVGWVRKPFSTHELRAAVDGAMQRSNA
ncbi:MAG TPA: response regulator [Acidimicrobiia bacterium]|nr:response regulator [Acidimicrobiia bacterium]